MSGYRDHARPAQPSPAPDHPSDRLLYTTEEAADMLAISRSKMYSLIGEGAIKSLKIGRHRRITPAALSDYIAQLAAVADAMA